MPESDSETRLKLIQDLAKVELLILFEDNLKVLQRYKIWNCDSLVLWLIALDEGEDLLF